MRSLTTQKVSIMSAWGELVAHAVENGAWPREAKAPVNVVPLRAAPAKAEMGAAGPASPQEEFSIPFRRRPLPKLME